MSKAKTPAERTRRDERALSLLLSGESWEAVAARCKISRVQLWRRLGKRLAALRSAMADGRPSARIAG